MDSTNSSFNCKHIVASSVSDVAVRSVSRMDVLNCLCNMWCYRIRSFCLLDRYKEDEVMNFLIFVALILFVFTLIIGATMWIASL